VQSDAERRANRQAIGWIDAGRALQAGPRRRCGKNRRRDVDEREIAGGLRDARDRGDVLDLDVADRDAARERRSRTLRRMLVAIGRNRQGVVMLMPQASRVTEGPHHRWARERQEEKERDTTHVLRLPLLPAW
jgi:hypothetical protein